MRYAFAPALLLAALVGCRGPSGDPPPTDLARLVDSLTPAVERAAGMRFAERPKSAIKTRAEVGRYILEQLDRELPRTKRDGLQTVYRLLGFLPDTFDLERALLSLYSEQVAGYYDPDTKTLYGVSDPAGATSGTGAPDPRQSRLVIAHELVHALQGQRLPLDAMLHDTLADADRRTARQAILEGQATLASIEMLAPEADIIGNDAFWDAYREQVKEGSGRLPVFRDAPEVLRLGLVFPYIHGAEFMRWWIQTHGRDSQPYGAAFPESSEQILHPDRYAKADHPVTLRFAGAEPAVLEDVIGEAEMALLSDLLIGTARTSSPVALGWGGDRYRVMRTPAGPAVDWAMVFDEPRYADRYRSVVQALAARGRPGYRAEVRPLTVAGKSGFRVIIAPTAWDGWAHLPEVTAVS